jgi:hypothetical protein
VGICEALRQARERLLDVEDKITEEERHREQHTQLLAALASKVDAALGSEEGGRGRQRRSTCAILSGDMFFRFLAVVPDFCLWATFGARI